MSIHWPSVLMCMSFIFFMTNLRMHSSFKVIFKVAKVFGSTFSWRFSSETTFNNFWTSSTSFIPPELWIHMLEWSDALMIHRIKYLGWSHVFDRADKVYLSHLLKIRPSLLTDTPCSISSHDWFQLTGHIKLSDELDLSLRVNTQFLWQCYPQWHQHIVYCIVALNCKQKKPEFTYLLTNVHS